MIKIPSELISSSPFILVLVITPILVTALFSVLNARRDSTKVALKYIETANAFLKPTFNTSNKKQIYLTEQLFKCIYKYPFNYYEITALLNCKLPSKSIELFLLGKKFLELSTTKKSFVEKEGPWYSIFGKSPLITNIMLLIIYSVLAMIGGILSVITWGFIRRRYLESNESFDIYFIFSLTVMFFCCSLIIIAVKFLRQVGKKKIAVEFINDNFPL